VTAWEKPSSGVRVNAAVALWPGALIETLEGDAVNWKSTTLIAAAEEVDPAKLPSPA